MKIMFADWTIAMAASNARQYDDNVWALDLTGELPEGWAWAALIAQGEHLDIIELTPNEAGASAILTADQLSMDGYYTIQIRGTKGDQVRHTNLVQVFIPRSLSGDATWPTLPTEFSQAEARIAAASAHPPIPGENGYWMIWDVATGEYKPSDTPVPGGGGSENAVQYTPQTLTAAQKGQARENIGAQSVAGTGSHTTSWLLEHYPEMARVDEATSSLYIYFSTDDAKNIPAGIYVFDEQYANLYLRTVSADGTADYNLQRGGLSSNEISWISVVRKLQTSGAATPVVYELFLGVRSWCRFSVAESGKATILATGEFATTAGVLTKTNKTAYTPTADYHPATKKYVDDSAIGLTGAAVGQIAKITEVDAEGKPTKWEPVDLPGGGEWEKIADVTLAENASVINIPLVKAYKTLFVGFKHKFVESTSYNYFSIRCKDVQIVTGNQRIADGWWWFHGLFWLFGDGMGAEIIKNHPTPIDTGKLGWLARGTADSMIIKNMTEFDGSISAVFTNGLFAAESNLILWGVPK